MTASTSPLALVTGANRGLGLEVCRQLAVRGWRVWFAARNPARAESAAAELHRAGLAVQPAPLDVTRPEQAQALATRATSAWPRWSTTPGYTWPACLRRPCGKALR